MYRPFFTLLFTGVKKKTMEDKLSTCSVINNGNNNNNIAALDNDNHTNLEKEGTDGSGDNAADIEKESSSTKEETPVVEEEPHSIYSRSKKLTISLIVSYAGLVSPFSGTIYYPALPQISQVSK